MGNIKRNVKALSARIDRQESTLAQIRGFHNLDKLTPRRVMRDDEFSPHAIYGLEMTSPKISPMIIDTNTATKITPTPSKVTNIPSHSSVFSSIMPSYPCSVHFPQYFVDSLYLVLMKFP